MLNKLLTLSATSTESKSFFHFFIACCACPDCILNHSVSYVFAMTCRFLSVHSFYSLFFITVCKSLIPDASDKSISHGSHIVIIFPSTAKLPQFYGIRHFLNYSNFIGISVVMWYCIHSGKDGDFDCFQNLKPMNQ